MRWVGWRIAVAAAGLVAVLACTPTPGPPAGHPDFAVSTNPIGGPCTANSDCESGLTCFVQNFLNDTTKVTTPGGYCTRSCTGDGDCSGASCINFGSGVNFCLARCTAPGDCRTGYACWQLGSSVCFSNFNLNCDPTSGSGTCTTPSFTGGCIRTARGGPGVKSGLCRQGCNPGRASCPSLSGSAQACYVVNQTQSVSDGTVTGDKFHGAICLLMVTSPPPIADGLECLYPNAAGTMSHFFDVCVDGDECYITGAQTAGTGFDANGDNVCHQMCNPNGPVFCTSGTCHDVFGLFNTNKPIGLCF